MKKTVMKKWVALLRSGEFKQAKNALEKGDGHCCLGVLCNLALVEGVVDYVEAGNFPNVMKYYGGESSVLPVDVKTWAGMEYSAGGFDKGELNGQKSLARANDSGATFLEIAEFIEKNYKDL